MPVTIEIQNLQKTIPLRVSFLKREILAILKAQRKSRGEISFVFVSDQRIRQINKDFLRHDYSTDVITFNWRDPDQQKAGGINGEIIISAQTAMRNAKQFSSSVHQEILLYMVHGILHLIGYDDHSPSDAAKMRAQEKRWLAL